MYQLAKCRSASLFNVMYAGIITALRLLGAPQNLVVGTPASGRLDAEFFDTVGYFTTMVVHMNRVEESLSVVDIIEQVKQTINGSMPYTDIPIDLIEEALLAPGEERENHIFEVFIQLHAKQIKWLFGWRFRGNH
ncbi:condensation domain-containing protein [Vibrio olivae]